jgi:hypothetical protein
MRRRKLSGVNLQGVLKKGINNPEYRKALVYMKSNWLQQKDQIRYLPEYYGAATNVSRCLMNGPPLSHTIFVFTF